MRIDHFKGGEALRTKLQEIRDRIGKQSVVKVGFLEGATYPDGTPVAMVAAIQNYGAPGAGIPARPFFSNMVAEKSPNWGKSLGTLVKTNDYNVHQSMSQMGMHIASQLQTSIKETNEPALAKGTILARASGSKHGEIKSPTIAKALIDTGHMQNSVDYEVEE